MEGPTAEHSWHPHTGHTRELVPMFVWQGSSLAKFWRRVSSASTMRRINMLQTTGRLRRMLSISCGLQDIRAFRADCVSIPGSYTEKAPGVCTEASVKAASGIGRYVVVEA